MKVYKTYWKEVRFFSMIQYQGVLIILMPPLVKSRLLSKKKVIGFFIGSRTVMHEFVYILPQR